MEEYLVAIRDWVLILLSVVMVFTGILRYLLTRSSPTPDAKMVNEGQVVIRARSLNAVANLITPKCFRHRRFYFSNESLTFAWSAWINYFFSGFVTAKIPFSLAQRFRSRLQNGIDLSTVDASYVCSRSQSVSSYTDSHLPEGILTEILARLPLRSISRFKSVCRTWKSALDSVYFRRLFVSLHQNTSSSWSLVCQQKEFIDFHGCQTWGLPKSLGSYIRNIEISGDVLFVDSSNGLVLINVFYGVSVVGNPLLQQWVVVPSPPYPYETMLSGLVTRVDEDGVILSFKVVRTAAMTPSEDRSSTCLCFCVYSSETGIWTCKRLHCPHYFTHSTQMTLHGMLYISPSGLDARAVTGALIAHDFYGESNVCRVIPLPDNDSNKDQIFKRALTTSSGFVMYIKPLAGNVLKVWRLLNHDDDDSAWQLVWETRLQFIPFDDDIHFYVPLTMHPFDHNIVYLWSIQFCYLVSCNLQTQNYNIFIDQSVDDDLQNCFVNQSVCEKTMDGIFDPNLDFHYGIHFTMFQSVLPRWMGSMPRPPQAEMLDTTSLLSYITSHITLNRKKIREKIRKNRGFK